MDKFLKNKKEWLSILRGHKNTFNIVGRETFFKLHTESKFIENIETIIRIFEMQQANFEKYGFGCDNKKAIKLFKDFLNLISCNQQK